MGRFAAYSLRQKSSVHRPGQPPSAEFPLKYIRACGLVDFLSLGNALSNLHNNKSDTPTLANPCPKHGWPATPPASSLTYPKVALFASCPLRRGCVLQMRGASSQVFGLAARSYPVVCTIDRPEYYTDLRHSVRFSGWLCIEQSIPAFLSPVVKQSYAYHAEQRNTREKGQPYHKA